MFPDKVEQGDVLLPFLSSHIINKYPFYSLLSVFYCFIFILFIFYCFVVFFLLFFIGDLTVKIVPKCNAK